MWYSFVSHFCICLFIILPSFKGIFFFIFWFCEIWGFYALPWSFSFYFAIEKTSIIIGQMEKMRLFMWKRNESIYISCFKITSNKFITILTIEAFLNFFFKKNVKSFSATFKSLDVFLEHDINSFYSYT